MRVYREDVLSCPKCGSKRKIIAFIEDPAVARKILDHLGLGFSAPPRKGPRPAPQRELFEPAAFSA